MRASLTRLLVFVLTLTLLGGNAHATLHLGLAHDRPCGAVVHPHASDQGSSPSGHHHHDNGLACCCDCAACGAAYLVPPFLIVHFWTPNVLRYALTPIHLIGRALVPDPYPPRSTALI